MSGTDSSLAFSALFQRALGFWPDFIDVTQLYVDSAHPDLYVVIGLGKIGDSIANDFSDDIDAVLMTNIHEAISSMIRLAAPFCTEIKPSSLRPSAVRENLEKRLHSAVANPDLGWSSDDIFLIKQYFAANP